MTKIRMLAAAAALAFTLLPADADAQTRPGMRGGQRSSQSERAVRFYALAGYAQIDVDELNTRLASLPEPYSPVSEDMFLFGGGLHGRLDRFIVGGEFSVMGSLEDAEVGDERRAELTGFTGSLLLGFSILQTYGFDFYPLIQLGGAGATLTVEEREAPSWDEVLADPGRSSMMTTVSLYGAAGLGMDYTFRNGFFMGVRGTYAYTPPSDNWTEQTGDVLGGPEMDLSGPAVRLMLGFGGR